MSYEFPLVYDKIYSEQAKGYAKLLVSLIKRYFPSAKTILDLGCGTGNISILLSKHFEIVGVDNSKSMLSIAKKKGSKVTFLQTDIRYLNLNRKFDVMISTNDVINHATTINDLKKMISSISKHLVNHGIFIFDYNTISKLRGTPLKKHSNFRFFKIGENFVAYRIYRKKCFVFWEIICFLKKGKNYVQKKETIKERIYKNSEIEKILMANNLKILRKINLNKNREKIIFVTKKYD